MKEPIFSAVTDTVMPIITLLKCIAFKPRCIVRISSEGLKLTVEDSLSLQAHAFLDKSMFSFYRFNSSSQESMDNNNSPNTPIFFTVSLLAMLECFNIMNNDLKEKNFILNKKLQQNILRVGGSCHLSYIGDGHPFVFIIQESGMVTTCELTTFEKEDITDIFLQNNMLNQKIIIKVESESLYDAIQELEFTSSELLTIRSSPQYPYLRLSSVGTMGSVIIDYTNEKDVIETFSCSSVVENSYKFSMIRHSMHAMSSAIKVSIRTDQNGVLSMQFMIETGEGKYSFVDFRMLSSTGIENNFYNE
ncbi:uncharacterized protein T551_00788 [Pneumocystis jirovecii RU7]|uniref:Cell cycle checkpoint protein RAD1 n=1 Tax=Pneumocystis jirovecii (strain RU7) TaxID=1408657 RepID=A0A0W4ZUQ6_PNEJ7|nr:uncharacterized protein T551_00788 [Pneumocystis jirovecii RU7]KTW32106.1 hypothetical protein T551_00788 [Pneumocystis jirovecii RU7]